MKIFSRRPSKIDPDDLIKQTTEVNTKLEVEGPRIHAVANWLINRTARNGFGEDFEITLIPKSRET